MIGIDLVYIPEFRKQLKLGGTTFLSKSFSVLELDNLDVQHLSGIWAAKEAVAKALPTMPKKWTDIVISYDSNGKPMAQVKGQKFEVSISHHGDYAVAVAHKLVKS